VRLRSRDGISAIPVVEPISNPEEAGNGYIYILRGKLSGNYIHKVGDDMF
jgi:hypothetical protein